MKHTIPRVDTADVISRENQALRKILRDVAKKVSVSCPVEMVLELEKMGAAAETGSVDDLLAIVAGFGEESRGNPIAAAMSAQHLQDARDLLPFAQAVLASVPGQTEEAAFVLMEKFQEIRDIAVAGAVSARSLESLLDGTDGHVSVNAAADHTRNAVQLERKSIAGISQFNQENENGLKAISDEINSGLDLLDGINEITERLGLISFNLAVEASHIGSKGGGFKIIADELRKLNAQSADFSHSVAKMLLRYRDHNTALVHSMSERSDKVVSDVEDGMDAAEEAIETLIQASAATSKFAREISDMSKAMDRDLDKVLESLQFQDITRQMVEGALSMIMRSKVHLDSVAEADAFREKGNHAARKERVDALRKELLALSKTKGEKTAIEGVKV